MKNVSCILFALFCLGISSCEKTNDQQSDHEGILKGTVGMYIGNCMPVNVCEPIPVSTTIAITTPSDSFNTSLLIDSVVSAADGTYQLSLPAGDYSLFIRDSNIFVCESWSCAGECYCKPFVIKNDSTTTVDANLDHATW